ncbi:MAG TPA: Ni/Fe-hydrogenase, b-type cytochrome subunit [Patescibacteria group bacterium]|nr:Ni/Fe-hydrogenase, b-type cytochrome subunit [Patescibacteria group bacterium]
MNATAHPATEPVNPLARGRDLIRVYVWEKPVRIAHWVIFFSIFVLAFTGYYMYNPFVISRGNSVFLMAKMHFVHEVTAFVFIGAVLVRSYWWFTGSGWAHWTGFVSAKGWWRRGLWRQLKYYFFLRNRPSTTLGHNPLASVTYMFIWALFVVEIVTGMALLDFVGGLGHGALAVCFGWVFSILSVTYVREVHFLIMFAFLAFVIHHVYSAVLVSMEEGTGLMDAIFSGYKFFPARCIATDPTRRPGEGRVPDAVLVRAMEETPGGGSPSGKQPATGPAQSLTQPKSEG